MDLQRHGPEAPGSPRLGVVTIGQSPRPDMVPEMTTWLPLVEIVERGALDDLDPSQIASYRPRDGSDEPLETRLRDGTPVTLTHRQVVPLVQAAIDHVERGGAPNGATAAVVAGTDAGVDATLLVCTGEFPGLRHTRPLLTADRLLTRGVAGLCGEPDSRPLAVICPLPSQYSAMRSKWSPLGRPLELAAASPYADNPSERVAAAAQTVAGRGAAHVILDCMGYTQAMRVAAHAASGRSVLLARSIVARLAGELIDYEGARHS